MRCTVVIARNVVGLAASAALAGPAPDYDFQWATITHAGNRDTIPSEVTFLPDTRVGSVAYEYRMARTEVTLAQWAEFGTAYLQANPTLDPFIPELLGYGLLYRPDRSVFIIEPRNAQGPAQMSWRMAARYCNWLQNGKASNREAFEQGAYDTSTFTQNPDGTYNDQAAPSPGALFWMPTRNEWTKAAFYDPNRYGPGQEGYWRSPNGTDESLLSGLPELGGQTNAGREFPNLPYLLHVGSYTNVQSPWGLWDLSGGVTEWSSEWFAGSRVHRLTFGSSLKYSLHFYTDVPDPLIVLSGIENDYGPGLRLASAVPSGSTLCLLGLTAVFPRRCRHLHRAHSER